MKMYAVARYTDVIEAKDKKAYEKALKMGKYYYFTDDEEKAKQYIVRRALLLFEKAALAQTTAKRRYLKCIKRFGGKP